MSFKPGVMWERLQRNKFSISGVLEKFTSSFSRSKKSNFQAWKFLSLTKSCRSMKNLLPQKRLRVLKQIVNSHLNVWSYSAFCKCHCFAFFFNVTVNAASNNCLHCFFYGVLGTYSGTIRLYWSLILRSRTTKPGVCKLIFAREFVSHILQSFPQWLSLQINSLHCRCI